MGELSDTLSLSLHLSAHGLLFQNVSKRSLRDKENHIHGVWKWIAERVNSRALGGNEGMHHRTAEKAAWNRPAGTVPICGRRGKPPDLRPCTVKNSVR